MKIPKKCKITILGDSISKGICTKNNRLTKVPNNAVKLIAEYFQVDINNVSVYGQTLSRLNAKGYIDEYLKSINKKDYNVAVLSLGGNDADYNWPEVAELPDEVHLPKTPPKEFEALLNETIQKLKKQKVHVFLTNIPPIDSKRYFEYVICKIADRDRVLKFLNGDVENIYRHQELYNSIITKCAAKNQCHMIDIRSKLLSKVNYLAYMSDDGIHPNETGQRKIAEAAIEQIKAL